MTMTESLTTMLGLLGVAAVLTAYGLLTAGRLSSHDIRYPLLNLAGTLLILCSLLDAWNLPAVVTQAVWIVISLLGIWRIRRERRR